MDEDVDGHAANGAEGGQGPEGALRGKTKNILSFANDNKRLQKKKERKKHLSDADGLFKGVNFHLLF